MFDSEARFAMLQREVLAARPMIFKSARKWCAGNEADADDLTQEVVMMATRKLSTFRGESTVRTWMYGIMRYLALAERRKRKGREINFERFCEGGEIEILPSPSEVLAADDIQERIDLLFALIDRLPRAQRDTYYLVYREGLSAEETARRMHVPYGTVKSRLFYGKQKILEALAR